MYYYQKPSDAITSLKRGLAGLGFASGLVAAAIILTFGLLIGIYVPNTVNDNKVRIEYTTILVAGYNFSNAERGTFFDSKTAFGNITGWGSVLQPNSPDVRASLVNRSLCSFLRIDPDDGTVYLLKTGYYQGGVLLFGLPAATDGSQQIYVFGMAPYISINTANLAQSFNGYPGFYGMPFIVPGMVTTANATQTSMTYSQPFQFYYNGTVPLQLSLQVLSVISPFNSEFGVLTVGIGIQRMENVVFV